MKIKHLTGKAAQIQLDKRQHVPYHVEENCPKCGALYKMELNHGGGRLGHYLSYPTTNAPTLIYFYCECGHEWQRKVIVRLTLEEFK